LRQLPTLSTTVSPSSPWTCSHPSASTASYKRRHPRT
jgi:hypothetical protein